MTTTVERYRSLRQSRKLLEELCDPGKTPRVPSLVRDRARSILRHYPTDLEIDQLATNCPNLLEKPTQNDRLKQVAR